MQKRTKRALVAAAILVLLLVVAIFLYRSLNPGTPADSQSALENAPVIEPEVTTLDDLEQYVQNKPVPLRSDKGMFPDLDDFDHRYGNPDADTVVILYANMTNQFAGLMLPDLMELAETDEEGVVLVYRHFPSENPPEDLMASMMSECVFLQSGEEGFWAFTTSVIGSVRNRDTLLAYASEAGASVATAEGCVDQRQTWNYVLSHRQQAELKAKIKVSPSMVIWHRPTDDVRILAGANPMSYVQEVLGEMR